MALTPFRAIPLAALRAGVHLLDDLPARMRFLVVDQGALGMSVEMTQPTLRVVREELVSARDRVVFPFDGGARVTIGRSSTKSDIVIRHPRISGIHAAIAPGSGASSWLVDLASSNGTFLTSRCLAPGEAARVQFFPGADIALAGVAMQFVDESLLRAIASGT